MILKSAIPDLREYDQLVQSTFFGEIECVSNQFIEANSAVLAPYRRRWVRDPLHQWSRQWEYPYVLSRVEAFAGDHEGALNLLDAGSGITFFPFLLASRWPRATVNCCDCDPVLHAMYKKVNEREPGNVRFETGDIGASSFADNTFELIYCISVIEHLDHYNAVLKDFARILKPGGRLILTFDIALDGINEIPPERAQELLDAANAWFTPEPAQPTGLADLLKATDSVTTRHVQKMDPSLLPWGSLSPRRFKPLLHGRPPGIPQLTVFCGTFESRKGSGEQ